MQKYKNFRTRDAAAQKQINNRLLVNALPALPEARRRAFKIIYEFST